jgi:predicted RNase H-like nuclease (RuvC/YqgF family)
LVAARVPAVAVIGYEPGIDLGVAVLEIDGEPVVADACVSPFTKPVML